VKVLKFTNTVRPIIFLHTRTNKLFNLLY